MSKTCSIAGELSHRSGHKTPRVRLDYKPDLLLRLQAQRFAGTGRQMHFEPPARIYFRDDHWAFSFQRYYSGGHDVSGAQRARKLTGNYDVSRSNCDTDFGTNPTLDSGTSTCVSAPSSLQSIVPESLLMEIERWRRRSSANPAS